MPDNIPFEIQLETIKKASSVKSLIQFRSVSKPWKYFIDSSEFIKGYGARHTQPGRRILMYKERYLSEYKYICLVDDDTETFKGQQQEFVVSPFFKDYLGSRVVGECHGLLCLICFGKDFKRAMIVVWNPSIGKSFGIALPRYALTPCMLWIAYGFGVCPVTSDPTVVRVSCQSLKPWRAEVFTLTSGVWSVIPSSNLLRQSVTLSSNTPAVIDRFIYWGAHDEETMNPMVVSFDMITKEFKVVNLPDHLRNEVDGSPMGVSVARLRGSLVVLGNIVASISCGVWVMERDSSFRKLFTIGTRVCRILGFSKSGEPIIETRNVEKEYTTLDVYGPCSNQIKSLGISAVEDSFVIDFYKESLLLLDHSDSHIYPYVN